MVNVVVVIVGLFGLIGFVLIVVLCVVDYMVLWIVCWVFVNFEELYWNFESGEFDLYVFIDVDVVVNFCGVNIVQCWWLGVFKQSLCDSWIIFIEVLFVVVVDVGVVILINVSVVGYYGNIKDWVVDENDLVGIGFLVQLCVDWEIVMWLVQQSGVCVVLVWIGVVLFLVGGML